MAEPAPLAMTEPGSRESAKPAPTLIEPYAPTRAAAQARIDAVRPADYARTRNALDGAVSGLSPYITHGWVTLSDVLAGVTAKHPLPVGHKFIFELGWRGYFRHVWQHRAEGILHSLHEGLLPDEAYLRELPADIQQGQTGVPVIDEAVRVLYATGMLHNHARMWLASYVVHVRKVHWRTGADWLYGYLLDGDLASNHLSWQWVAGTGSRKPYLFNAENVARYAPPAWHSAGSVIDTSYEALDRLARQAVRTGPRRHSGPGRTAAVSGAAESLPLPGPALPPVPALQTLPPANLGTTWPDPALVAGRDVWLVHPWSLSALPADLSSDTLVIGLFVADFHQDWPWSERRWQFVGRGMAALAPIRWHGSSADIGSALASARSVRSIAEPHADPWLARWAVCAPTPALFAPVARCCGSFSQWWTIVTRRRVMATDLLADASPAIPPPLSGLGSL